MQSTPPAEVPSRINLDYQLFLSEESTLTNQLIVGQSGGSKPGGDELVYMSLYESGTLMTVALQLSGDAAGAMSVCKGHVKSPSQQALGSCTTLTAMDKAVAAAMTVANLPGTIKVEYLAEVADGTWLLVTRPEHDWSYEDFRLFHGPAEAMLEHPVTKVTRFKDGGTTIIEFTVDGAQSEALFPVKHPYHGDDSNELTECSIIIDITYETMVPKPTALYDDESFSTYCLP